ncbi:MAG: hypothetical protein R3F39_25250 [Myxococcota bacterium]
MCTLASAPARADASLSLPNGIEVVPVAGPADGLVDIAVQFEGGLAAEGRGSRGQAAALAALLGRGPSHGLAVGDFEREAERAGLTLGVSIGWRAVTLHVSGPEEALQSALWLALDRLRPAAEGEAFGDELRAALFVGAERTRQTAVGRLGTPADMLIGALLGESDGGSPFASRLSATQLSTEALESLALDGRATSPVRVLLAVPEARLAQALRLARGHLADLPPRDPPARTPFELGERPRSVSPPPQEFPNPTDDTTRLVMAWDLRGVAHALGLSVLERDAALLTLRAWLDHPGSTPNARLTDEQLVAREMSVTLSDEALPVLTIDLIVRGTDVRDARAALTAELERLAKTPPPESEIRGAAALAATELRQRWGTAPERARIVDTLTQTGRITDTTSAQWMTGALGALDRVDAAGISAFAAWAFRGERLAEARVANPADEGSTPDVDADVLGTYLRIMVDLRCPAPGQGSDVVELLTLKYAMDARQYVLLTRTIAQRPAMMRQLTEDAELRCQELTKLRGLMPRARALELYEAVTCGPERLSEGARRDAAFAALFERYRIDPSWYGPLVGMLREEVGAARTMDAIAARCRPSDPR